MNFTDDELRMILDALSSLNNNGKLDAEDVELLQSIRIKVQEHFKSKPSA